MRGCSEGDWASFHRIPAEPLRCHSRFSTRDLEPVRWIRRDAEVSKGVLGSMAMFEFSMRMVRRQGSKLSIAVMLRERGGACKLRMEPHEWSPMVGGDFNATALRKVKHRQQSNEDRRVYCRPLSKVNRGWRCLLAGGSLKVNAASPSEATFQRHLRIQTPIGSHSFHCRTQPR
jgi:hypothetical protein